MKIFLKFAIIALRGIPLSSPKIKKHNISIDATTKIENIVHISDLHIGEFATSKFCKNLIKKINATQPDIILISGDMITSSKVMDVDIFMLFKNLKSKKGIFFIAGNRELEIFSIDELRDLCNSVGFIFLNNETVIVDNLKIAGVTNGGENLSKNIKNLLYKKVDIIFSHQPKSIKIAQELGLKAKLFLCGHTHGGQLNPFGRKILKKQNQPYFKGRYSLDDMSIYVNSGVGSTIVPIRFLSTSEIALLSILPKM